MTTTRLERDALGDLELKNDALYGIATQRGVFNFAISGQRLESFPELRRTLAQIKRASAMANAELDVLDPDIAQAIAAAAEEVEAGAYAENFPIDLMEGSGGTSLNMNINEVLASLSNRKLNGHVHPNDHVNAGQSTNDVVPSAVKLAAFNKSAGLLGALDLLAKAFDAGTIAFEDVLRVGRTCLQAGQPMTLGQAFSGYAHAIRRQSNQIAAARRDLLVLPLGGTAIGTGLGSVDGFREAVFRHLQDISGLDVEPADNHFDAMQNADAFSRFSSALRVAAEVMGKIASDLILLNSGPHSGIGEIVLPAVQAGSSIMPGKINPVIPMMVQQTAYAVIGNDTTVSLACLNGQLEINHFEPVIALRLFDSIKLMKHTATQFANLCVSGIHADRARSIDHLLQSPAMASVFLPKLGYDAVTALVKRAALRRKPFVEIAIEEGLMSRDEMMVLLREAARVA